jgi:hypothetical protein
MTPVDGGCSFAEPPDLPANKAHLFWDRRLDRHVLTVDAFRAEPSDGDSFMLRDLVGLAAVLVTAHGTEHLLVTNGYQRIQLDVLSGTLLDGRVDLKFRIPERFATRQLPDLQQFLTIRRRRVFPIASGPLEAHAWRWIRHLRVHDALAVGASARQIAIGLFGEAAVAAQWHEGAGPLRASVQRFVRRARTDVAGGYRNLLI